MYTPNNDGVGHVTNEPGVCENVECETRFETNEQPNESMINTTKSNNTQPIQLRLCIHNALVCIHNKINNGRRQPKFDQSNREEYSLNISEYI